jgi:cell division ATPase FtsA
MDFGIPCLDKTIPYMFLVMFVGDNIILLNQNVISNVDHFMNRCWLSTPGIVLSSLHHIEFVYIDHKKSCL